MMSRATHPVMMEVLFSPASRNELLLFFWHILSVVLPTIMVLPKSGLCHLAQLLCVANKAQALKITKYKLVFENENRKQKTRMKTHASIRDSVIRIAK